MRTDKKRTWAFFIHENENRFESKVIFFCDCKKPRQTKMWKQLSERMSKEKEVTGYGATSDLNDEFLIWPQSQLDLFDYPHLLPENVLEVLQDFSSFDNTYSVCKELKERLNSLGYTFEFYLDAQPFNLKSIS